MLIEAGREHLPIIPVPRNFPFLILNTSKSLLKQYLLPCCVIPLLNCVGSLKEFSIAKCCLWPLEVSLGSGQNVDVIL